MAPCKIVFLLLFLSSIGHTICLTIFERLGHASTVRRLSRHAQTEMTLEPVKRLAAALLALSPAAAFNPSGIGAPLVACNPIALGHHGQTVCQRAASNMIDQSAALSSEKSSTTEKGDAREPFPGDISEGRDAISWYPGHIGKAERMMNEVLSMVDVVVELRDARAPAATTHPSVPQWVGSKGHVLALCRRDQVPDIAAKDWKAALDMDGQEPYMIDGVKGTGVAELRRAILRAGKHVNERRIRRGIRPRAVRCAVLGFPNVGKSALINRLVNRRKVRSENKPGVTRGFQWIRIDDQVELLDSPGIIPANVVDQSTAYRLAMCDDIGQAAYENQQVAHALFELLMNVDARRPQYARLAKMRERYGIEIQDCADGTDFIEQLAQTRFTGDIERAAFAFLKDFRKGRLGNLCIELPADSLDTADGV